MRRMLAALGTLVALAEAHVAAEPVEVFWSPGLIARRIAARGHVVIALVRPDPRCDECWQQTKIARGLHRIDAPGEWHVTVVYGVDELRDAGEILAGAELPVLALYRDGHLLGARAGSASATEAADWLARTAARTRRLPEGPLPCTRRLIDLLVATGRLGAADLVRYVDLRARGGVPPATDPLATAWGALASWTPLLYPDREIELGDVVLDERARPPRLLVVDRPTAPEPLWLAGTFVDDSGVDRPGRVSMGGRAGRYPRTTRQLAVLRPTGGTFCDGP